MSVTLILEEAEIWVTDTKIRLTETLVPKHLCNITLIFGVTHILGYRPLNLIRYLTVDFFTELSATVFKVSSQSYWIQCSQIGV